MRTPRLVPERHPWRLSLFFLGAFPETIQFYFWLQFSVFLSLVSGPWFWTSTGICLFSKAYLKTPYFAEETYRQSHVSVGVNFRSRRTLFPNALPNPLFGFNLVCILSYLYFYFVYQKQSLSVRDWGFQILRWFDRGWWDKRLFHRLVIFLYSSTEQYWFNIRFWSLS